VSLDLQEKIRRLEQLVELDPNDATGLFMLGKLYLDAGHGPLAAEVLERCIAAKPDYSAAYRFCGDAWRKSGETGRARDVYERGIAIADANGDLQTVKEMKVFLAKLSE